MKNQLFYTRHDWAGLITRLTLGIVIFPHGAQKLLGMFGGYGFSGTMGFLTGGAHLPWIVAFMVIIIEFFGSLSLILGFAGRIWGALMVVLMLGIIFSTHIHNGFFMNWDGSKPGEGFEYHLLAIGLALTILMNGSGKYSVDGLISDRDAR